MLKRTHQLQLTGTYLRSKTERSPRQQLQRLRPTALQSVVLDQKWQLIEPGILEARPGRTQTSSGESLIKAEDRFTAPEQKATPKLARD